MRLEAEEHEHPPTVETPPPQEPDENGDIKWRLDYSLYRQRKRRACCVKGGLLLGGLLLAGGRASVDGSARCWAAPRRRERRRAWALL